jgi:hypothetical protein
VSKETYYSVKRGLLQFLHHGLEDILWPKIVVVGPEDGCGAAPEHAWQTEDILYEEEDTCMPYEEEDTCMAWQTSDILQSQSPGGIV